MDRMPVFIEESNIQDDASNGLENGLCTAGLSRTMWGQWKTHIDITDTELALKIVVDHPATLTTST